jgi:NADH-quinone oxidoreductase subunit J
MIEALLLISAVCVIVSRNLILSIVFLVCTFLAAAILIIKLEVDFLGLILVVIYVGAIAVLFLFAVMLVENKLVVFENNKRTQAAPIGFFFGVMLFLTLIKPLDTVLFCYEHISKTLILITDLSGVIDACNFGGLLYSYFAVQVLIVGMVLLVIILGITKLTKSVSKKKVQSNFKQLSRNLKISENGYIIRSKHSMYLEYRI